MFYSETKIRKFLGIFFRCLQSNNHGDVSLVYDGPKTHKSKMDTLMKQVDQISAASFMFISLLASTCTISVYNLLFIAYNWPSNDFHFSTSRFPCTHVQSGVNFTYSSHCTLAYVRTQYATVPINAL